MSRCSDAQTLGTQGLKDNPEVIFTAATKAQEAADWMYAQQLQAAEEMASG
ncbi:hypothetical protein RPHASCH2410_PD04670 (plasmid) [Rhizobium phaseoli Ch24-10]|nr:hypothetical protein RPHASCH2410_PD04670 [Rhizobium phaseoli Ch24-10]